jgi:Protein ENHANCED DISEASE RESISTANCE 2, C-terminal
MHYLHYVDAASSITVQNSTHCTSSLHIRDKLHSCCSEFWPTVITHVYLSITHQSPLSLHLQYIYIYILQNMVLHVGFTIEGRAADELPECILACATLNYCSLDDVEELNIGLDED